MKHRKYDFVGLLLIVVVIAAGAAVMTAAPEQGEWIIDCDPNEDYPLVISPTLAAPLPPYYGTVFHVTTDQPEGEIYFTMEHPGIWKFHQWDYENPGDCEEVNNLKNHLVSVINDPDLWDCDGDDDGTIEPGNDALVEELEKWMCENLPGVPIPTPKPTSEVPPTNTPPPYPGPTDTPGAYPPNATPFISSIGSVNYIPVIVGEVCNQISCR